MTGVADASLRPAAHVKRSARANPASEWPRPRSNRAADLLERSLARPVITPSFTMTPGETVFTLGSCFTRAMEDVLHATGFVVPCAEFAIPEHERSGPRPNSALNQYVPPVMLQELRRARDGVAGVDTCLVDAGDDEVVDMQLFAAPPVSRARGIERRREVAALFRRAFTSDVAIVTLGQIEAWWDAVGGQYCNQMPTGRVIDAAPERFYFRALTLDEIVAHVSETCELLCSGERLERIIITVSPVPISRAWEAGDALTGYVHAKSVLRVAAEAVASSFPQVDYFPSYDIVALSDRSTVFAPDRMHIRQPVVDHIAERMISCYVSREGGHRS